LKDKSIWEILSFSRSSRKRCDICLIWAGKGDTLSAVADKDYYVAVTDRPATAGVTDPFNILGTSGTFKLEKNKTVTFTLTDIWPFIY
jgi:hypothetical protein